jgi:iron complex outermembrane receptor protein
MRGRHADSPFFSEVFAVNYVQKAVSAALCVPFGVFAAQTYGNEAADASAEWVAVSPTSDSASLAAMPLEALLQVSVTTTASKFEQPISDAPSAVTVLTADDIRSFGWRTLAEALASLPGVYVSSDRNYTYLGARGFSRPGDYGSRFLLMIDGYRTNDAVYDQAALGFDALVDIDLVDRIEYVPGPGSAVYGPNAFFGVVNVITKAGGGIDGAQAAVAIGSYGEKKGRASYGWKGENGAKVLLSATSTTRRGQDLYFPEFDTPEQNHGVARGLDGERSRSLFAKASYGELAVSAGYVERDKSVPTASFGAIFNAPDSTRDSQTFVNALFTHRLDAGATLSVQTYWGRADYRGVGVYPSPTPAGMSTNVDGARGVWYGADVHATLTDLPRQKIVVGADIDRDARRDQYTYDLDPFVNLLDDKRSSRRTGAYVEDEIRLPWASLLNAGLRYDWDSVTGGNVNPRLALIRRLAPRTTMKLIYGTAYRAPNAYELYYAVAGDGGQLPNPRLKPERIRTKEVVLEQALGASGRATASVFQYSVRDLISQETTPDSGMLIYRNLDRATAHGAEFTLEQRLHAGARLRASYTWQRATDTTTGARLQNSPRHLAKLNLLVPVLDRAARLGSELQCMSSRLAANSSAGGFCVANFTIGSSKLLKDADASLGLYNAFDKRYSDPSGPAFLQEAIQRPSRTVYAKLVYGF